MLSGAARTPASVAERMRRGGERDVEVRRAALDELAAPDERVERVVVDEPAADERPQRRGERGDPGGQPCGAGHGRPSAPRQRGERAQQLAAGALAEVEALEPVGLVRRVDVVLGQCRTR